MSGRRIFQAGAGLLLGAAGLLSARPSTSLARPWFTTNYDIYALGTFSEMLPIDANHDGELDLITGSGTLALGQPNGDFVQGTGFTPPLSGDRLVVFDYNGDGLDDVMVTGRSAPGTSPPQYIFVYRKLPGNGFAAALPYILPANAGALFSGDFDGNGLDDALTLHRSANYPTDTDLAAIYLAVPGGMGPRLDIVLPEGAPSDAAVADFDEDGMSDAIILCRFPSEATTLAYYMSSAGGFQATPIADSLQAPNALNLGVADVNQDGHVDFATANGGGTNSVFLGNGDGTFDLIPLPGDAVGQFCGYVQFDDVDLDGHLDLVGGCAGSTDDIVNILYGDGDGHFGNRFVHHFGRRPNGLVVHDFDHDGFSDIAGAMSHSVGIGVLRGNAAGTFNVIPAFPTPSDVSESQAIDWDDDGGEDLVTVNRIPGTISILHNLGGQFEAPVTYSIGFSPAGIRFVDVDLDGDRDIVAVERYVNFVKVLLCDADGGFSDPITYAVGVDPTDVAAGDFNGDGIPDLVVSNYGYPTWSASFLRGTGGGQFQPAGSVTTQGTPTSIATGDFNEDGKLDFVTGHAFDKCSLVLGRGDGTFNPSVAIGTSSTTQTTSPIQVYDMNNDGHQDLVGKREHGVGIRYGTGLATFGSVVVYSMGSFISNIAVRDFDLDGWPDMASASLLSDYATVRFGAANGFGGLNYYGVDRTVIWVTPIAFDRGPSRDLAVVVSNGPKVMILAHQDAISDVPMPKPTIESMPFALAANPSRTVATFRMTRDLTGPASASIVDVSGRRVAAVPEFNARAGVRFDWHGKSESGHPVAAGRYYAILGHDRDRWSIPFLWFP